jgi:pimeloyl-ACP methyl ester carboxylesterase
VDKHGPQERYNFLTFLGRITCPTLILYGERELEDGGPGFVGVPREIANLPASSRTVHVETVAGADHFYTDVQDALAHRMVSWLTDRTPWG